MSLIELLVVISILGIISAIFVPNIGNISSQARFARDERNAQNVATLLASAKAGGATNVWNSIEEAIDDLEAGMTVGPHNAPLQLSISPLSAEERAGVTNHLSVLDGMVYYQAP